MQGMFIDVNKLFISLWSVQNTRHKKFTWETVVKGKKRLLPFGISYAWE